MKLKDIELRQKSFYAMEYYLLILNRTLLIIKTDDFLIGLQGNGSLRVEAGQDVLTREVSSICAFKGDLANPYSYLKNTFLEKYLEIDLIDGGI